MAKAFLGEVSLSIHGRRYTLKPSLGALYEIEQRLDMTIPEAIAMVSTGQAPAPMIRTILQEGLAAAGHNPANVRLSRRALRLMTPALCHLLLLGLGCVVDDPALPPDRKTLATLAPLDWEDMYRNATGMMGKNANEFWHMTLTEYRLAFEGFCMLHGIESYHGATPATSLDLSDMMERFPD